MSKGKPFASYTIRFFDNHIEAGMTNFEKLNARKIEQGLGFAVREWQRLRQQAVNNRRKEQEEPEPDAV